LLAGSKTGLATRLLLMPWNVSPLLVKGLRIAVIDQQVPTCVVSLPHIREPHADDLRVSAFNLELFRKGSPCSGGIARHGRVDLIEFESEVDHRRIPCPKSGRCSIVARERSHVTSAITESSATRGVKGDQARHIIRIPCGEHCSLVLLHCLGCQALSQDWTRKCEYRGDLRRCRNRSSAHRVHAILSRMPPNGFDAQLRNPLKRFRRRYIFRRHVAQAAHRLGPKGGKSVGGGRPNSTRPDFVSLQRLVIRRRN
jgi:hypothetical protein